MTDIGSQLRKAREERGLSLEQVQKATRIKRVFLEAIEADRLDDLPGPVQARGFVRSYASHVGLDPDALLPQREAAPRELELDRRPASVRPAIRPPAPDSALPLPLPVLIVGMIVLFVVGGLLILQALAGQSPPPAPTLPAGSPLAISRTPDETPDKTPARGVSLTLTADEHVWVRVTRDGITAFEGMLQPGEAESWEADQQVIVETGNGAALMASVNGADVGVMGPRNRVVVRAWGAQGEVTPAPTATPAAPESSATPAA